MKRKRSTLSAVLGAGAVAAAGGVYYWLLQRPLPQVDGELRVMGLDRPVEVRRDSWGVPHIRAETAQDLMFGQGFVHAQDRLWQMELWRRLGLGRLAEVLGDVAVPVDRWMRVLGFADIVAQEARSLSDVEKAELTAYVAGINARLARGRLPIEFTLTRHEPEPWTIQDVFLWPKMMAWQLSVNWQAEVVRAALDEKLGPELAAALDPPHDQPLIVPAGVDYARFGDALLRHRENLREYLGPTAASGIGSNGWVVAGSRTTSGAPLLASDMHLSMTMPSIWYENHLVCEAVSLNLSGISMPGVPYVLAGHNGNVAWAFTNAFADVQDLFVERMRERGRVVEVMGPAGWEPAEVRHELISVRGSAPVSLDVVVTRHGPVVNSLFDRFPANESVLALSWTSFHPGHQYSALREMAHATDVHTLDAALRHWAGPALNVVSADRAGNIAYRLAGRIPVRAAGDGRVPVPGWSGAYDWTGTIPFAALPHVVNPPEAALVSANNQIVPDDYPFVLGYEYATGARAARIHELLGDRNRLTVADFQVMQLDQLSVTARAVSGLWQQLTAADPAAAAVLALLRQWDGRLEASSPAAAAYEVFMREMLQLVLGDRLGSWFEPFAGKGPTPQLADATPLGARSWEWLVHQLLRPSTPWFASAAERDDLALTALRRTHAWLVRELGPDEKAWSWGAIHRLTFHHVLGYVPPLDALFNRGPFPVGGDSTTVWATGIQYHTLAPGPMVGPPGRFIVDLGDIRRSRCNVAPGQSGQPGSAHYDDQVESHLAGEYHALLHVWEDVVSMAAHQLWLNPVEEP